MQAQERGRAYEFLKKEILQMILQPGITRSEVLARFGTPICDRE
jgi:hypothetical protein